MMKTVWAAVMAVTLLSTGLAMADEKHDHDHQHDAKSFASVAAGLTALEGAISQAKSKAAAGDMKALHDISEDLHGIAEGLRQKMGDVAVDAKDRFKFNVDQIENLHAQLEAAHESANKENVDRVIKRLEDVARRLKALVSAS